MGLGRQTTQQRWLRSSQTTWHVRGFLLFIALIVSLMTEKLIKFLEDFGISYREMPEKASELIKHFKEISIEENIYFEWVSLPGQILTFQKVWCVLVDLELTL
jgi:hypothetical protein